MSALAPVWEETGSPLQEEGHVAASMRRDALMRRSLALSDVIALYVAVAAVVAAYHGSPSLRWPSVVIAPFVVLVGKIIGLYDRDQNTLRKTTIDEVPALFHVAVVFALTVWLAQGLLFEAGLSRPQVFGLVIGGFLFMLLTRSLARHVVLTVTAPERCVLVGNAHDATRIVRKLHAAAGVKARVVGRVSLDPGDRKATPDIARIGDAGSLPEVVRDHCVERAIVAPDAQEHEDVLHAIRVLKALGVKVSVFPRLLEVVGSSSTYDDIDGVTLLGVRQYGLSKSSEFLKRAVDIVVAASLIVLLAPVLLIIALIVKLDSPGPLFFVQGRIGRRGRRFKMLKFRSMVHDAEQLKDRLRTMSETDGLFKISDDPRITRAGKLLRPTSLDELPQLFNVLRGDMSLVGPRPLVIDEDALIEGWQRRRLTVRPGMTGLWQIYGSARIPMSEMVKIDYMYGANWSLWLDLKILIRTVPYVLRRRGM